MSRELILALEGFPTVLTFVRLLARVIPLVDSQLGIAVEGFPAFFTCIGLLTCVGPLMDGQV